MSSLLRCSRLFRAIAWAEVLIWRWLATGELRRPMLCSDIAGRL